MNKKLNPLVFIALIFLALVGFLVLLFIDGNNGVEEPEDVSVTGFGDEATSDLFPFVAEAFLNTPCEVLFHEGNLQDPRMQHLSQKNFTIEVDDFGPSENTPTDCFYVFNDTQAIGFRVRTYNTTSQIDSTRKQLFDRVNSELIGAQIDQGRIGIIDYSFGTDKINPNECIATLYHPLNDFEVGIIEYYGFDCENEFNLNRELVTIFGNYVVFILEDVYNKAGNTSTEELLREWEYDEYLDGMEFYR